LVKVCTGGFGGGGGILNGFPSSELREEFAKRLKTVMCCGFIRSDGFLYR